MNDSIFAPNYIITPAMAGHLQDIERQRWLIENMLLMPKHEAWLRREVSVRRAVGTTSIEGASLEEAEVNQLLNRAAGDNKGTEDEQANLNALAAYEFIDFISDQSDIPIDELVIRQLNRNFMRGAAETLTPGAYRKGQNSVGNYSPPEGGRARLNARFRPMAAPGGGRAAPGGQGGHSPYPFGGYTPILGW